MRGSPFLVEGGKTYFADRYNPSILHLHEIRGGFSILIEEQSEFQLIQIFDTKKHGRVLVLDGFPQISERDGWLYTEAMVLPALLAHSNPQRILILGGGDGAAMSFCALDPRIKSITLVDIDERVIALTQEYIPPLWRNVLKNDKSRFIICCEDALAFLKREPLFFDVIILDITDPNEGESARHLLSSEFFGSIKSRLALGGILAMQSGEYSSDTRTAHESFLKLVSEHFAHHLTGAVYIPWFSTEWSFTFARNTGHLPAFAGIVLARHLFKKHSALTLNLRALTSGKLAAMFAAVDVNAPGLE